MCQVTVGDKACNASGPNKKLAKRNAAEQMLQLLGYSRPTPQPAKPAIKTTETMSPVADKKVTFIDLLSEGRSRGHPYIIIIIYIGTKNRILFIKSCNGQLSHIKHSKTHLIQPRNN